tara:strand:- start:114 stop:584 length:471 start_codon:yes stop_codon:yes gene_type:complete
MDFVTASQLQGCFTPEDDVWFPDLAKIVWQDLDFLGWVHPSGHLAYIVAQSPNDGALKGVVLRRFERPRSRVRLDMCSLCLHVHGSGGTAMFSITEAGSRGRRTISNVVCTDLACSLRIRNKINPSSLMQETLYLEAKVWRILQRLHRWLMKTKYL